MQGKVRKQISQTREFKESHVNAVMAIVKHILNIWYVVIIHREHSAHCMKGIKTTDVYYDCDATRDKLQINVDGRLFSSKQA